MKKLFVLAVMLSAFAVNAQRSEKTVDLSMKNYDVLRLLKEQVDFFKSFTVPEKMTQFYDGDKLLYTVINNDGSSVRLNEDSTIHAHLDDRNVNAYFSIVKDKLIGYLTLEVNDTKYINYYYGKKIVHDENIRF